MVHSFLGLPSAVSYSDIQDQVTLVELPGILDKTESFPLIENPTLTTHKATFDLDDSLWTVQALKLYLEQVSIFYGSQRCLLVNPDHTAKKEIHADCITKCMGAFCGHRC